MSEVPLDGGVVDAVGALPDPPFTGQCTHQLPTSGVMTSDAHSCVSCELPSGDKSRLPWEAPNPPTP